MHALEAGVPAGNDLAGAVGEGDGRAAVDGGVELGAVGEPACVVDGVILAGFGEWASADDGVDVAEGIERLGGAFDLGDAGWVIGGVCRRRRRLCSCCRCGCGAVGGGGCGFFRGGGGLGGCDGGECGQEGERGKLEGHREFSLGRFGDSGMNVFGGITTGEGFLQSVQPIAVRGCFRLKNRLGICR